MTGATARGGTYAFPSTFAQQRLWFLEQLQPGGTSYLIPWFLRATGKLNVEALARSFNQVIERHEILRTTFSWKDGMPVQVVHPALTLDVPVRDISASTNPEAEAEKLAREEAQQPLDLERGPLVRAQLLRLGEDDHVLLLTLHHIIFDGSSRRVLVRELRAFYEANCTGQRAELPPPKLQYADYAVWQRKHCQGAALERHLAYWRKQLAGSPASLELATDRPRPAVQSFHGAKLPITISKDLAARLSSFSRSQDATLFMTLLAGFQTLLYRSSHQDDIVVGALIANRNRAELEDMMGFFANTLALRTRFREGASFEDVLAQVKETTLDACDHQDLPFEKLVEDLQPERNLSHNPLFQVLFSFQNLVRPDFELPGLKLRFRDLDQTAAKFDISVFLSESPEGIAGRIEYNTDLFDRETIERMGVQYCQLLETVVASPQISIPGVGWEDRNQMVLPRNDLERTILRVWQQVLGLDSIGVTHNFFDIGGHSLLAIRMIAGIQEATGKRLPVSTLFEGATVEYLASALTRLGNSPDKMIVEIQGGNANPPFFGIVAPGAGGLYFALAQHLGKAQPFYRIQGTGPPPGRRPYTAIEYESLAAEYIEAMKTAQPRGPYYLGGGCQGARIAFDMARLLEAQGEKIGLLAIFDTWVIENSRNRLLFQVDHYSRRLMEFWRGTRWEKSQTLRRGLKHPFRRRGPSHLLVAALWPGPDFVPAKCAARITVFKGPTQRFYYVSDPLLGWATRTTGGVELQLVDSSHRSFLREPGVRRLAEKLADALGRASSTTEDNGRK